MAFGWGSVQACGFATVETEEARKVPPPGGVVVLF
jgi:hypothetical protein